MNDNPTVNRSLRDKGFDHIDHALGRPVFPLRESYRNYFATDRASNLARRFKISPFWCLSGSSGDMDYYAVTDAGRKALAYHLVVVGEGWRAFVVTYKGHERIVSAKSPSKAKYDYFLDLRDVFSDLSFIEFASAARVWRAA